MGNSTGILLTKITKYASRDDYLEELCGSLCLCIVVAGGAFLLGHIAVSMHKFNVTLKLLLQRYLLGGLLEGLLKGVQVLW